MTHGPENTGGIPPGEQPPSLESAKPGLGFLAKALRSLGERTGMGDLFARGGKLWEGLSEFVDEGIIRQLGLKLEGADLSRLMNTIREFTDISQLVELFGEKAADFLTRVMAGLEGLTDEPRQLTKLAQKLGLKIPIEPRK